MAIDDKPLILIKFGMARRWLLLGCSVCLGLVPAQGADITAFPGAEGFGAMTVGGRGGKVIEVTNLDDSGPGSFRAACEAEGARTVVFRTGGTIRVSRRIEIRNPHLTIAGQTAPGGGICLRIDAATANGGPLKIMTSQVILRHLRFRPGPPDQVQFGENVDALTIGNVDGAVRNVIVDHCSFSWATDELLNTWYDVKDVTIQWCLFSEALARSGEGTASHSKGPLLGSKNGDRQTFHHNLMVHNAGRNPMVKMVGLADVVNNVAHVPSTVAMSISDEYGPATANFIGNCVTAPKADGHVTGCVFLTTGKGFAVHARGNVGPHLSNPQGDQAKWFRNMKGDFLIAERHPAPAVTEHEVEEARQLVLDLAGAILPARDSADARVVEDVVSGHTHIISHPQEAGGWPELEEGSSPEDTDHDGMPDAWERAHGLNADDPADGAQDHDGDGYSNLEDYLNSIGTDLKEGVR